MTQPAGRTDNHIGARLHLALGRSGIAAARLRSPSGSGTEESLFRYRLHTPDGGDVGEATYAVMINPGEEILYGNGRRFRVVAVVPFDEEDESPFVGLLQVEAA